MSGARHPLAEAAARTYQVLARALDYPDAAFWAALAEPHLDVTLDRLSPEEREAEYLASFETGGVPLYEGLCLDKEGREGIQEDLLRFYHFFGLRLSGEARDFPDHLSAELEFMGHLLVLEEKAWTDGRDASPFRLAQRDFLARHLARWVPELGARMDRRGLASDYRRLVGRLEQVVATHLDDLETILGPVAPSPAVVAEALVEGARP